jgi:hydroxymethylglutaryl-CoA reductase
VGVADKMVENVVAVHGLPLGVALNFQVNKDDVVVPMAVEEPSVVAAASNAARMVRACGGFHGEATPSLMTAQVQFDDVPDCDAAAAKVLAHKGMLLAVGDAPIPRMVERGFGCRDLEVRVLDRASGLFVVHVYVDVGDAMGANTVDTVAEALAGPLHELVGAPSGCGSCPTSPRAARCARGASCRTSPWAAPTSPTASPARAASPTSTRTAR